jgi:hypothetical protein
MATSATPEAAGTPETLGMPTARDYSYTNSNWNTGIIISTYFCQFHSGFSSALLCV